VKLWFFSVVAGSLASQLDDVAAKVALISAAIASAVYIGKQIRQFVSMGYKAFKRVYDGVEVLEELPAWMQRVDDDREATAARLQDGSLHMSRLDHRLDALHGHTAVPDQPAGPVQVEVAVTDVDQPDTPAA
jgi:hypothetical protein